MNGSLRQLRERFVLHSRSGFGATTYVIVLLAFATASCDVFAPDRACPAIAIPGINVSPVDSVTNAAVPITDVMVIATDGVYADTVSAADFAPGSTVPSVGLAYERRGTYTLKVVAAQYRDWVKSGIRVEGDQCHVNTVSVTARLQRSN